MKSKNVLISVIILSMTLFISACAPDNPSKDSGNSDDVVVSDLEEQVKERDKKIDKLETDIEELESEMEKIKEEEQEEPTEEYGQEGHILVNSVNVLKELKEKDMDRLERYIHPEKGVRFSAYPYIDPENDVVLKREELNEAFNSSKKYIWGNYDGRGNPIELSFKEYYKEFVYDEDFLNPHMIAINKTLSSGNSIDNINEIYPEGEYIESYFEGFNEEYAGADWRSLKLVFEEYKGKWYLVGIIHGEWTI